ncbi:MAG: hypothetical protein JKY81_09225 [Colwellia sp.]|nr:hypothetical protein [Colwellia sp.]
MKLSATIFIALLLISYAIQSHADESNTQQVSNKISYRDLITNSSAISQRLHVQDLAAVPVDNTESLELTSKITGEFTTRLLSIEAGMLESKQDSNWNKYYVQGAVTLHQHNEFNVSLMANIEQINNFNHRNAQIPFINNPIMINETELNYSYGIITSYSVTPAWQFSGGIIRAESLTESTQNSWYGDANIALVGTTYSF